MTEETQVNGLVSDSDYQSMSQLSLDGRALTIDTALGLFLQDVTDLDEMPARFGCEDTESDVEACVDGAAEMWMEMAYRGALSSEDLDLLHNLQTSFNALAEETQAEQGRSFTEAERLTWTVLRAKVSLRLIFLSPKFLFHYEPGMPQDSGASSRPLDSHEIANRLSFFIAASPPDEALLTAAELGLSEEQARRDQVERLLSTEESVDGVVDTLSLWLGLDADLANEESISEAEAFLRAWVTERRPFADLYTSPVVVAHADGSSSEEPFGLLGLQAVVASNTNPPVPSFINRGEFIVETLVCAELPLDVPDAAMTDVEDPVAVFEVHAQSACATCHHIFDNYGASLQRFDLDTFLYNPEDDWLGGSFELYPIGDLSGTVSDPAELGQAIASSQQAQRCMAELWFRHAMRRGMLDSGGDEEALNAIVAAWGESDTSIASLLEIIVAQERFAQLQE